MHALIITTSHFSQKVPPLSNSVFIYTQTHLYAVVFANVSPQDLGKVPGI